MNKCIVYTRADGGLSIYRPFPNAKKKGRKDGESEEDFFARTIKRVVPIGATGVEVIDKAELPATRVFRNAWKHAAGVVDVDMVKARPIRMDQIRELREKRWKPLDDAYRIYDEAGDIQAKADIGAIRQALRDLPETIAPELESIKDADALAIYEPVWPT